jgi:pimeloyl-ACP methyl ester carboxylesterase
MDAWDPTILRDLSSKHTVIIFDNRGVGNTTAGTKPFSIIQFANDIASLLDALKIQKADVLGFSMGTFIAQQLTLFHPEKVNRLVLYAASCGGKENIPQSPEVVKILSDLAYNRSHDLQKFLSVAFPLSWIKSHPWLGPIVCTAIYNSFLLRKNRSQVYNNLKSTRSCITTWIH